MLPSRLDLIGRPLGDVEREFKTLLLTLEADVVPKDVTDEQRKQIISAFNDDLNGWINWLESLKR